MDSSNCPAQQKVKAIVQMGKETHTLYNNNDTLNKCLQENKCHWKSVCYKA